MTVSPPRLIFWESTAGCNLRCLHCRRLDVLDEVSSGELRTAEAVRLIDQISEFAKPILVFSGGEPLLRPDIFDLASHARSKGLRPALATNGTMVTEERADSIRDAGVARVSISLDGATAATHDRLRGEGNFERALEGFRLLKARGVSLQINMTVTRHNAHELPELYRKCIFMGADALHLFMLVPVGCGVQLADSDMLPAEEYERWLHWMYDREVENQIELKATCAPHYFRVVRERSRGGAGLPPSHHRQHAKGAGGHPQALHQVTKGCLAGTGVCFISHMGDVFPCGYLPVQAGNVRVTPFREIWDNSPVFNSLRNADALEGKCGACSFRFVCGGCRARAYSDTQNMLSEEPFCVYKPPQLGGQNMNQVSAA